MIENFSVPHPTKASFYKMHYNMVAVTKLCSSLLTAATTNERKEPSQCPLNRDKRGGVHLSHSAKKDMIHMSDWESFVIGAGKI